MERQGALMFGGVSMAAHSRQSSIEWYRTQGVVVVVDDAVVARKSWPEDGAYKHSATLP